MAETIEATGKVLFFFTGEKDANKCKTFGVYLLENGSLNTPGDKNLGLTTFVMVFSNESKTFGKQLAFYGEEVFIRKWGTNGEFSEWKEMDTKT